MSGVKYAIVNQLIDRSYFGLAQPWIKMGAKTFNSVDEVPKDHVLLAIHFAPWWSPLKEWIAQGNKWIEIDYGYWGHNLPRRNTRRVTYCDSHNTKLKTAPYSRINTLDPAIGDWRQTRGNFILVIEPQQEIIFERTGVTLSNWKLNIEKQIKTFWDGDIVYRKKRGGKDPRRWPEYLEQLNNCYGVIGERTMACVEAAMLGYQAYTVDHTVVSLLMGNNITDIMKIKTPDRTQWLNHIAWSQFTREDFENNYDVAVITEQYQIL